MADKKIKKPNGINSAEWKELLHVLDELENRPRVDEVEEMVSQHRKTVREVNPPAAPGTETNTGDPFSLLIVPSEVEEEQRAESNQLASLLLSNLPQNEEGEDMPGAPAHLQNPLRVLAALLIPRRGDAPAAVAIKSGILVAVVAVLAALALLVNNLFLAPYANRQLNRELFELYDGDNTMTVADTTQYPEGMLAAFKQLYTRNNQVRGWLSFHSTGDADFINVEYPVVQTDNNKDYQKSDFDKNANKNGTLFFDQKCRINGVEDTSRVLMVYGNSMGNGQMLSGLADLMGSANNARLASTFTLSTLYEKADYYVLAVVLLDGKDKEALDYKRTVFADEDDFFNHVQAFRDRSLFDYPTDLRGDDELAIIGTNVSSSVSNLSDGRLLVLGRRQRPGETGGTDLAEIVRNEDVIMPYRWYMNQKITPHDFYYQPATSFTTTTTESTTTTTAASGDPSASDETGADGGTDGGTQSGTDASGSTTDSGSTSSVNKNTYTTSHTYSEASTTTTSRSVPTGIVITKVPQSTTSTTTTTTTGGTTSTTASTETEDTSDTEAADTTTTTEAEDTDEQE